jgi:hypothetical protein
MRGVPGLDPPSAFYLGYLTVHPARAPAVLLFLFEFAVLDHYLSNQFIRWPAIVVTIALISVRLWCLRRTLILSACAGRVRSAAPAE